MTMMRKKNKVQPLDVFTCALSGISNIEASAGTGKTWAICGLYLRLIAETDLNVNQVLVVTFTNAATAELRSRIRGRLVEVLQALETGRCSSGDPFTDKFLRRIDHPGGDIAGKVCTRLKAALSSFEDAAIYTIHSFCQRTLGEVPFAAVQPFMPDVEANDTEVVRQIATDYWRRMIDRYSADEVQALMAGGINPDWLTGELKRIIGKPAAKLVFPVQAAGVELASRRAAWLKRILLCLGPDAVRAAKRRRRVISYNDMLYNLYEALKSGRFPWLAGDLRSRFPAALIDEFQDTDPLQFEIFRSIYSGGGTLFLVGDPKQAIYAFRSADLNTYLAAKRLAACEWTLAENQRSENGLISAVNAVFGMNKNVFCSSEIPYHQVQRGSRTVQDIQGDPEPREPLSVWLFDPGTKDSPVKASIAGQHALDATAAEMSRLIAGGMQGKIKIGDRPVQPRDIAVLVRTKAQGQTVKAVLSRYGISSVDLSDRNVFDTMEAVEMERVLLAIAESAKTGLLRAALSTVLMGLTSMKLAELNSCDIELNRYIERMEQYRLQWLQSGFGSMWRRLIADEQVVERLLPTPEGERQITNWMHLMELMITAEEKHRGIESLLRWLGEKMAADEDEEVSQLRLESDENLVQIVTKHRAKGLEWPIVFCPFIWKEPGGVKQGIKVYTYHEGDRLIIDYTGSEKAKSRQEEEEKAERVRLIYVALTRAINRCYIAAGPFWQTWGKSATETAARKSIMNWIVAGNGDSASAWTGNKKATIQSIHKSWQELLAAKKGIGVIPWPAEKITSLPAPDSKMEYKARNYDRTLSGTWKLSSYSSLTSGIQEAGRHAEPEARDYDIAPDNEAGRLEGLPERTSKDALPDIIDFPVGTTAGHCLHAIFERIDFQDDSHWPRIIADVLAAYPPMSIAGSGGNPSDMISRMLKNVVSTQLPGDIALKDVPFGRRLSEFEFTYPVRHLDHEALNALLARHGRSVPVLTFTALEGYLRGFIDLVFEYGGKWYVVDWKSNKLGAGAADYARERLNEEMFKHAYELQGLIYLTALHRYLKDRIPAYDYNIHIGGIFYLFVRGVKSAWPFAGIWCDLPEAALIESMDALFSTGTKREGGGTSDG